MDTDNPAIPAPTTKTLYALDYIRALGNNCSVVFFKETLAMRSVDSSRRFLLAVVCFAFPSESRSILQSCRYTPPPPDVGRIFITSKCFFPNLLLMTGTRFV